MIQVEKLSKAFRKKSILKDVTFQAAPGEMVAFVGNNGCGKSTLMQILSGMIAPDGGSIQCYGHTMGRNRSLFAKYFGYVPQSNGLMEELSVQDNLNLWTGRGGRPDEELIEMFDLQDMLRIPVRKLSGGMKRRVAIACAMAHFPPILLMDEPTAALDREYQRKIHSFMEVYLSKNGILLIATHDEQEIRMANRVIQIEDGYSIVQKKEI